MGLDRATCPYGVLNFSLRFLQEVTRAGYSRAVYEGGPGICERIVTCLTSTSCAAATARSTPGPRETSGYACARTLPGGHRATLAHGCRCAWCGRAGSGPGAQRCARSGASSAFRGPQSRRSSRASGVAQFLRRWALELEPRAAQGVRESEPVRVETVAAVAGEAGPRPRHAAGDVERITDQGVPGGRDHAVEEHLAGGNPRAPHRLSGVAVAGREPRENRRAARLASDRLAILEAAVQRLRS